MNLHALLYHAGIKIVWGAFKTHRKISLILLKYGPGAISNSYLSFKATWKQQTKEKYPNLGLLKACRMMLHLLHSK